MVEALLIGVGAAGNKAAIEVLEAGIMPAKNIKLFNSTERDIPAAYTADKELFHLFKYRPFGDEEDELSEGGCAKEPSRGRVAMVAAIKNGDIDLESMISDSTRLVIIVASTEGGTGSGAAPILAKYFEATGIPVHVFGLVGFQDDTKSINNDLEFFKQFGNSEYVTIRTILNDRFKDHTGNYSVAEKAANKEFLCQMEILLCSKLIASKQNIDDADHVKMLSTPGYSDLKHIPLVGVKNVDTSNKLIIDAFDNGKCMDYEGGGNSVKLAVVINASEKTRQCIDDTFSIIKRYTGSIQEIFRHIQYDGGSEYMDVMISGLPNPEKPIKELLDKRKSMNQDGGPRRTFADICSEFDTNNADTGRIVRRRNRADVANIFDNLIGGGAKIVVKKEE